MVYRLAFSLPGHGDPVDNKEIVNFEHINTNYFTEKNRNDINELAVSGRISNFDEVKKTFDQKTAMDEANRCFNCGVCNMCDNCIIFCPDVAIKRRENKFRYEFDYDFCKGCGICSTECPRHAISLISELSIERVMRGGPR